MSKITISKIIVNVLYILLFLLFIASAKGIELKSEHSAEFKQAIQQQMLMAGVELLLVNDGVGRVISPSYELKSGDRIRLRIKSSIDSEYSLYILDNQGDRVDSQVIQGKLIAATSTLVPSPQQGVLALDEQPGVEWLQLVFTAKASLDDKQSNKRLLLKNKHPHGKIEQIILRNVELQAPLEQQIQFDPATKVIYLSLLSGSKETAQISVKLGLTHTR